MAGPWSAMDPLAASSSSSSSSSPSSDSEEESDDVTGFAAVSSNKNPEDVTHQRKVSVNFEALSRHGYSGGPSVLYVPPPKASEQGEQDWSWSAGKRKGEGDEEESLAQRDQTRVAANDGTSQAASQAIAEYNYAKKQRREAAMEQRALSFSQKEKRKRDLGQTSRAKNYVEEEKRLLRDSGVYSGFDT